MKALVVGGNGFIGSHLVDGLIQRGWEVSILDRQERRYDAIPSRIHFIRGDLNQISLLREALTGVDVVFHLAWTTIHEVSNRDPMADVQAHLIPSLQLIEACRQRGGLKLVFISSGGTVYGPAQTFPIPETHPNNPITAYGITKLAVEKYLHMFNVLYGLDYVVFRPSVPYGPRQNPLGRQGAVAVFLYKVAHGLPITIWGDGSVTRDYFYISDLIEALIAGAEQDQSKSYIFNIGGSKEISLIELLRNVEEIVGRQAIIEYSAARQFDAPRITLDTQLARQVLDWQPKILLRQGLLKTWQWMSSTIR